MSKRIRFLDGYPDPDRVRADPVLILDSLWPGGLPALFEAFLKPVMRPGFALEELHSAGETGN